jgi:2'-5' RNA ligase
MEVPGVLILTVRMDAQAQSFFDQLRQSHFPPERNYLKAHLTLFHKLPDTDATIAWLSAVNCTAFEMEVTGLRHLGAGVAYRIESAALKTLRTALASHFQANLSPQDQQGFRAHITVQNKTSPEESRNLLSALAQDFVPFKIQALGLDVWEYLGGLWKHRQFIPFLP